MNIDVQEEDWALAAPFRITGHTFTTARVIAVTLTDEGYCGRGEAAGVYYAGETAVEMAGQIRRLEKDVGRGIDRAALLRLLPPGGARNAVDCALWDLESQRTHRPAYATAGLPGLRPLTTTYTVGADTPAMMAQAARRYGDARALKLKLTGEDEDARRVLDVREARPDVWLSVDANQGHSRASLERLLPILIEAQVGLIEQPLPVGEESQLDGLHSPIPIAADESARTSADIEGLVGRFDVVNIKLDKCGGLTEALTMVHKAQVEGLKVMVGNMMGTSLAMAPAFLLGQLCEIVDLDGPLFLRNDRSPSVTYENGQIWCPPEIWGGGTDASSTATV